MKSIFAMVGVATCCFAAPAQATKFTFATPVDGAYVFEGSVSSALDANNNTHIAWVTSDADGVNIRYARYDNDQQITPQFIAGPYSAARISITVDSQNRPHLTWIVKRTGACCPSGNNAVYYAGDLAGNGQFTVEQVSTNSTNPSDDSDGIYNAYVNGRPQIAVDASDAVYVLYLSDANSLNSFDNYTIFATRTGANSWAREQAYNTSNLGVTYFADTDSALPPRLNGGTYAGFIDISNYEPWVASRNGGWTVTKIPGFSGSAGSSRNNHAQIAVTDSGTVHYFWFDDGTTPHSFRHTVLNGTSWGTIAQIPAPNNWTSNLYPMTVDRVTGLRYLVHDTATQRFMLIEQTPGVFETTELDFSGEPSGQRALSVSNGFWSLVTASWDTSIHIHTPSAPASDTVPDAFTFTDQTNVATSTVVTSSTITVAGINAAAAISVTGGEYSVNSGGFTSAAGTVTNGQTVRVRHTSAATASTATNTVLTIGGVSDTFTSTTAASTGSDTTPNAFAFTDQTNVATSTPVTSNTITVSGIDAAAAISVIGGEYSVNSGSFTTGTGTVTNGQTVRVRHTSSAAPNTPTNTILTVGGVSDTFTSMTVATDSRGGGGGGGGSLSALLLLNFALLGRLRRRLHPVVPPPGRC